MAACKNWYVDVQASAAEHIDWRSAIWQPATSFSRWPGATSSSTPAGASSDTLDVHWNDVLADCDKIYAMSGGFASEGSTDLQEFFEERLRRPMGTANGNRFGAGVEGLLPRDHNLRFQVEAEMVIHGVTQAGRPSVAARRAVQIACRTAASPCGSICRIAVK